MLARRLLIVLAVLLGLTALAGGVAPRDRPAGVDAGATPPPGSLRPAAEPVEETLDAGGSGQRVVARVGQTVTITVESDALDTVSIAEMGSKTVEPESPARFELRADVPGSYAIELLEEERRIGTLDIRERES